MKNERRNAIRTVLSEGPVISQDQLRRKLARRGFDVTQATLSRDIHDLRLYKGPNGYVASASIGWFRISVWQTTACT